MEKFPENKAAPAQKIRTKKIVQTALLAALTCAATMVLPIPSPTGGYMNPGDAVVLLGAYLLGPVYGALAAGIGAALADALAGYTVYVPATLVIKAVMALAAALLYRKLKKKGWMVALCGVIGEIPMVVGYWLYDALLLKSFTGSAAGIPSNLMQAAFGVAVSTLLALSLRKSGYVRKEFPNLRP